MSVSSPLAKWEACLVGYFLGRSLLFNFIKNNAFNTWKKLGLLDVLVNDEGFIFFIFEKQDSCIRVIEGGPWYIGGILLILKKWHRMMKLTKEKQGTIPIWVKFYNIPMEFWDSEGLSRIVSAIGVPLFMDNLTSSGNRISFARVCVEIKASSLLLDDFQIKCEGETVTIRVEYQGVPVKCEHCGVFGHETKVCFSAQVFKLISLQKASEQNPKDEEGWSQVKDKGKRKVGEVAPDPLSTSSDSVSANMAEVGTEQFDTGGEEVQDTTNSTLEKNNKSAKSVVEVVKVHHSSGKGSSSQRRKKRSFNDSSKHKEVFDLMYKENFKIMGLVEAKVKKENEAKIFELGFKRWKFLTNSQSDCRARIWKNIVFFAVFVYAKNEHILRLPLFHDITCILKSYASVPQNSSAYFLSSGISDHSPVIVTIDLKEAKSKKPFKFVDFWASHPEFIPIVNDLDKDPLNQNLQEEERIAYSKYVDLSRVEESLAYQKSRVQWLGLGDRNSKFFFRTIKCNVNRGRINSVVLNNGDRVTNGDDVCLTFVNYFSNLFGKPFDDDYCGFDRIDSLVKNRVSSNHSNFLVREVTDKEIHDVLWSTHSNKAPGLDGYSELNSTTIALIPKISNANRVGDLRPISCCNTVYKCISKIIANRLKSVLPDLVDPVQSAFVQGRRISDNIFISQELMRGYHKKSPSPKCTMKVDIIKAYDNVRWDMVFSRGEGAKQGDPLSPYLFVLVMEILARILAEKSDNPSFKFHWRCKKSKIVNLCFADDLTIFCKGDMHSVSLIKEGLEEFKALSGLSPSLQKSHIFFSSCDTKLRDEILEDDTALNCATKVNAIVDNYAWRWPSVNTLEVKELIASTPSSFSPKVGADSIIWTPSSNGCLLSTFLECNEVSYCGLSDVACLFQVCCWKEGLHKMSAGCLLPLGTFAGSLSSGIRNLAARGDGCSKRLKCEEIL
ncbi:uncharacterized protein LOC114307170 [Camellia sinensis]|uniref:uncharacterized protein LOC114307170 n=1 Tax=Camellia sinensis TaxID=4442 RepID=UPI001036051B|nr:uncharacterized protein LOC114307170 [Camellia sinensis]